MDQNPYKSPETNRAAQKAKVTKPLVIALWATLLFVGMPRGIYLMIVMAVNVAIAVALSR